MCVQNLIFHSSNFKYNYYYVMQNCPNGFLLLFLFSFHLKNMFKCAHLLYELVICAGFCSNGTCVYSGSQAKRHEMVRTSMCSGIKTQISFEMDGEKERRSLDSVRNDSSIHLNRGDDDDGHAARSIQFAR